MERTAPADETQLAAGVYEYLLNDAPSGVRETWSVHRRADGLLVTRTTRDATAFGTILRVETLSKEPFNDLRFRRCEIILRNQNEVRAVYEFTARRIVVTRAVNGATAAGDEIELPENAVFAPLMRVFLGPTILQVAAQQTATPVLVPFLENPTETDKLLRPTFDQRRAVLLGPEALTINEHSYAAQRYQYTGQRYDEQSLFWLDKNGMLLRYIFPQNDAQVWTIQKG